MREVTTAAGVHRFGHPKKQVRDAVIVLIFSIAGPITPFALVVGMWMLFGFDIPHIDLRRIGLTGSVLLVTLWTAIVLGNVLQARRILPKYTVTELGITREYFGHFHVTQKWAHVQCIKQSKETIFESFQASEQDVIHVKNGNVTFKMYGGIEGFDKLRSLVLDIAAANRIRIVASPGE